MRATDESDLSPWILSSSPVQQPEAILSFLIPSDSTESCVSTERVGTDGRVVSAECLHGAPALQLQLAVILVTADSTCD